MVVDTFNRGILACFLGNSGYELGTKKARVSSELTAESATAIA